MSFERSYLGAWIECVFYGITVVSVNSTPSIDVLPSHFSTTLTYGSQNTASVSLRCEVSNLEHNHEVSWFKNGDKITENEVVLEDQLTDQRYKVFGQYNLQISPIRFLDAYKDSGRYECWVLNSDDTVVTKSDDVVVAINVIPGEQYPICKQFIDERHFHGNKSEYFSGDNVTLQCLSDPGKPQVILQWFRNDETTPLSTWVENTEFNVYPINYYALDLSTEETGTKFRCQLLQPARNCTIGPITIYDEPTINIYPEVTYVNSPDQAVTFTCSVETADPEVINYRWTVEKVGHNSLLSDSPLFNLSDDKTIKFSRLQSADRGEYNITCVVDYGFSSRYASASLYVHISSTPPPTTATTFTTSMSNQQTRNPSTSISVPSTTENQAPHITSPSSDHTKKTNTSVIIIASTVGGLGFLLLLTIVILAVCISKSRMANQPTRNSDIILNQHIEVNVIAHPSQENQTLHFRENIAYDSVDDQSESKNIYLEDNIANESVQNTRNDGSTDNGSQVQTLQSLENIAYESADDHGKDQGPYSRDNIAYEGVDGSDNNRHSIFPENFACSGVDDPENCQTSHLLENVAHENVDNHGKDQTTHPCENIAYESANDMMNHRNSKFGENIAFGGAGVQRNGTHLVDNVAYESVDTHNDDQTQHLRDNETHGTADGLSDDRTANLRENIAYESADNISAKDTAYAEGNLYETLEKKVRPTPDGNKGDVNKNVDRPIGSNNDGGQLREVGGQKSASGQRLTTDRSSIAGNTTNKTLDEMYAKPNKKRANTPL